MRFDRLKTALLAVLLLLVGGPALAHRGGFAEQQHQQQRAAREEAAATTTAELGAALRASLIAESVRLPSASAAHFELFAGSRRHLLEHLVVDVVAGGSSIQPRRSPALPQRSTARNSLPAADHSDSAPDRFRLASFPETRYRAFDLVGGEQHQAHQQFRLGIASDLFQGAWTDPVVGLGYHRARWYDPRNASWLSEDPAGTVDSTNLYAFVGWSPQSAADPLGRQAADSELDDIYRRISSAADEAGRAHGVNNWVDELAAGKATGTRIHSEMQRLLAPGGKYHHPRILTEVAVSEAGTIVDFGKASRPSGALVKDIVILKPGRTIDDIGRFVSKAPDVTLGVVDLKVGLFGAAMQQGETLKRFGVTNVKLKLFRNLGETQVVSGLKWAKKVRGLPVLSGLALGLTFSEARAAADNGDLNRALMVMSGLDIWQDAANYAGDETERVAKEYLDAAGASGEERTQAVTDLERDE